MKQIATNLNKNSSISHVFYQINVPLLLLSLLIVELAGDKCNKNIKTI